MMNSPVKPSGLAGAGSCRSVVEPRATGPDSAGAGTAARRFTAAGQGCAQADPRRVALGLGLGHRFGSEAFGASRATIRSNPGPNHTVQALKGRLSGFLGRIHPGMSAARDKFNGTS
jgi:hypothetical protein